VIFSDHVLAGLETINRGLLADGMEQTPKKALESVLGRKAMCDLSPIVLTGASVEGYSSAIENRIYLNSNFTFYQGKGFNTPKGRSNSVIIGEVSEFGYFKDWIKEGVQSLALRVSQGLGNSCENSVGTVNNKVDSYVPPSASFSVNTTKRVCGPAFDYPCGLPTTTCKSLFNCTVSTPMCRSQGSQDVFSVTAQMAFMLSLTKNGSPPQEYVVVNSQVTRNDAQSSSGDVFKLLDNIGLARLFGVNTDAFKNSINSQLGQIKNYFEQRDQKFIVATPDYIYLPKISSVSWSTPSYLPDGAAPFAILIKRSIELPEDLACKVVSCLKQSQQAGSFLIASCQL
jgi:hypothetical protein